MTVKGGRFEVDLVELIRRPIYWDEAKICQVKRCLWFYKENNEEFMPYDEDYCEFLEVQISYKHQPLEHPTKIKNPRANMKNAWKQTRFINESST